MSFFLLLAETQPTPNFLASDGSLDYSWLFMKVMAAMVLVCIAAVLVIKYVLPRSRFIRRSQDSQIEILERFTLEPKKNLYILRVAEKHVLIGTTDTSLSSLLELGPSEPRHDAPETKSK